MRLDELLGQHGLQDLEHLSGGSFTDLVDGYCRELSDSAGDAIETLEQQEQLPKGIISCVKKATSLILDFNHNLAVLPSFCKLCFLISTLLSELSNKNLLCQYTVILLQSLAKITQSLISSSAFKSLFSTPLSSRHSLCTTDTYLAGLTKASAPLSDLISLVIELATITLLSNSNKTDGRATNYIQLLEFIAIHGPLLSFIGCVDSDEKQAERAHVQVLTVVERVIPSSILHILTHRASTLKTGASDVSASSEVKRLLVAIRQYMFSMHSLSMYAHNYEKRQDMYHRLEHSESDSEESDQRPNTNSLNCTTDYCFSDIDAQFSLDEVSFLKLYANTGLRSLNKALVIFIVSTQRKNSIDSMKRWLGDLYSCTPPSGRQITALAILLIEGMFFKGLKSYAPLSGFLTDLSEVYFMMNDMSVSARIIDIFVAIQESGPMGRDYVRAILYRNMLKNRLSTSTLCRKQGVYLLQALFPVSEEVELMSLDLDSLISALEDSDITVQEAAMTCSIAILSKYYDCMPFAKRSKLLSNVLESTFDISATIRSLAVNGLVELHKVPSLRADISSFAYNNREKLSLLLLDSAQGNRLSVKTSVQRAYVRFVCNIAHDAALLSASDASSPEASSSASQYRVLTTSMRLFYCTVYAHLLSGNFQILSSIFPTPTQTLLDVREENSTNKEKTDASGSEALMSFLQNIIISMGYLSGPLVSAVVRYFKQDIELMKQPETRLLGYAAVLKTLLSLACYLYEIISTTVEDKEVTEYMIREHAEPATEFCNPLSTLLYLMVDIYNCVLVEQDSVSRPNLRARRRNMGSLIKDLTSEWCSGCTLKFLTFIKEAFYKTPYKGLTDNDPLHVVVLAFYLEKLVMQLDAELCEKDRKEESLFRKSHSIEFSDAAISFAKSFDQSQSMGLASQYLGFLCQLQGFTAIDSEHLGDIDLSTLVAERKEYEASGSLLELSGTTNYKRVVMRYYSKELLGTGHALDVVKEAIVDITKLIASVQFWEENGEKDGKQGHTEQLTLACCCKLWSTLCYLYTYWLLSSENILPKDLGEAWTAGISLIVFSCTYLFKTLYHSNLRDVSITISDKSYSILSLLAGIGIDAVIVSLLINIDASYSFLVTQLIVQLRNYFMEEDAHSSAFTLRTICINNEGALGRIFNTEELESGSTTIVSLLLQKCILAVIERAREHKAERQMQLFCTISKLIASASLEDSNLRDAIFTLMEPDPKKTYYDLLLLARCLD